LKDSGSQEERDRFPDKLASFMARIPVQVLRRTVMPFKGKCQLEVSRPLVRVALPPMTLNQILQ
jgi:hypothetical protein